MALDINTGYSSAFKTFVDFAEKTHADGHDSAAAGPLPRGASWR